MKKRFIKSLALVLSLCMLMSMSAFAATQEGTYKFTDVDGHWAEETVYEMVDAGIINGYTDGTFRPEAEITWAEFIKIVFTAFNIPAGEAESGYWAAGYIAGAQEFGIIDGYADEAFNPRAEILRQDVADVIYRLGTKLGVSFESEDEIEAFADADSFGDYAGAIAAIRAVGIIEGRDNNLFAPLEKLTRAETVTIIARALALYPKVETTPSYKVTAADEAVEYDPAGHHDVVATRLHNGDDVGANITLGLSYYEPGGYAEMGAAPVELLYYVVSGEITVTMGDGKEFVLKAGDSIHMAPGVERSPKNTGDTVAEMLVAIVPAVESAEGTEAKAEVSAGYKVTMSDEGEVYEPAGHYDVVATRLHAAADVDASLTLGISDYAVGGYAEMGAAPVELIYYVLEGQMTVTTGDGVEHVLEAGDSIHFAAGVDRSPKNTSDGVTKMLVFSCPIF